MFHSFTCSTNRPRLLPDNGKAAGTWQAPRPRTGRARTCPLAPPGGSIDPLTAGMRSFQLSIDSILDECPAHGRARRTTVARGRVSLTPSSPLGMGRVRDGARPASISGDNCRQLFCRLQTARHISIQLCRQT